MDQGTISTILRDAIWLVLKCAMPMLAVALVIGVIISIFQAATQINEQTLAFVPKIIGVFLALLLCIGFISAEINSFVQRVYEYAAQLGL